MELIRIRTHSKFADAAYEAIRSGIRMGQILPGARLQEGELANQLGTSKTPVREALGRLISDGLASSSGRTGVYVTRLSQDEMADLYEARGIIEPPLARFAAERATDDDIQALWESVAEFERALHADNIYSLMDLDSQFHEMIASIAGNSMLADARERLDNCIAIARVTSLRRSQRRTSALSLKEHSQIAEAIANHDSKKAERRMAEHIRKRREGLLGKAPTKAEKAPAPSGA